jgi:hypothetical protein
MAQSGVAGRFAVKLIVAGQAGIKAGPAFLDALQDPTIYSLDPWAVDYDLGQFADLNDAHDSPQPWHLKQLQTRGYERALEQAAQRLGLSSVVRFQTNEDFLPNNRPPVLRCAANVHATTWCDQFLQELLTVPAQINTLIVLFVYNPDGQTSGSATLELARALRSLLRQAPQSLAYQRLNAFQRRWFVGVELGTPEPQKQGELRNTLCGYIRRKELADLMESEEDRPFDLSLMVDGGPPSVFHPSVTFEELDDLGGCLIGAILKSDLSTRDPMEVLEAMVEMRTCELAYLEVGFLKDEVAELQEIQRGRRSFNPLARRRADQRYRDFADQFDRLLLEPFRVAPSLTPEVEAALLSGDSLVTALNSLTVNQLREQIYNHLTTYYLSSMYKSPDQKFQRVMVYQRTHPENHGQLSVDPVRLQDLVSLPHRDSMLLESFQSQIRDRIPVDEKDDTDQPASVSILVIAGPTAMQDLGNFGLYQDAFDASVNGSAEQRELVKGQIAFPESWPQL